MSKIADNVISIPTSLEGNFFKYWLDFLKPFHNLTSREAQIMAALLKQRYQLSKVIKDDIILDKVVMSEDVKQQIREECNISLPHFQLLIGRLKANKLIVDGKINKRFIPNLPEGATGFKLLLFFKLENEA